LDNDAYNTWVKEFGRADDRSKMTIISKLNSESQGQTIKRQIDIRRMFAHWEGTYDSFQNNKSTFEDWSKRQQRKGCTGDKNKDFLSSCHGVPDWRTDAERAHDEAVWAKFEPWVNRWRANGCEGLIAKIWMSATEQEKDTFTKMWEDGNCEEINKHLHK
jgi:hypothetical protein